MYHEVFSSSQEDHEFKNMLAALRGDIDTGTMPYTVSAVGVLAWTEL